MNVIEKVRRVSEDLGTEDPEDRPFHEIISTEEVLKPLVTVCTGFSGITEDTSLIIDQLEHKYREIWDVDKNEFLEEMAESEIDLKQYEMLLNKYKYLKKQVSHEESTYNVKFIHIDCNDLKFSLIDHCEEWEQKLTSLLQTKARNELNKIHEAFAKNSEKVKVVPTDLAGLGKGISLIAKFKSGIPEIERRFQPIHDTYKLLEQFGVDTPEEAVRLKNDLEPKLTEFRETIREATTVYDECKQNMRNDCQGQLEKFVRQVEKLREDFLNTNLTTASDEGFPDVAGAFETMKEYNDRIEFMSENASHIKIGLDIFGIEQPSYKEIADTKKELKSLNTIWTIHKEWQDQWNVWKVQLFRELDSTSMDNEAAQIFFKIMKLQKKMGGWKIW